MSNVKVAVIGAGSYVFGPGLLRHAILRHRLRGIRLTLYGINQPAVRLMQAYGERLSREAVELDPTIVDKDAGNTALATCIDAHRDIAPRFG